MKQVKKKDLGFVCRSFGQSIAEFDFCFLIFEKIKKTNYHQGRNPSNTPQNQIWRLTKRTGYHRFLLNNFKYFLTLFSKFFSSFPHGTCSLSVSRRYLALDEVYHPFRVAILNNSTRRVPIVRGDRKYSGWNMTKTRGSHPLWRLVPKDLHPGRTLI